MTVDIKGYEGIYQVSDDAIVTNVLRNKPIKPWMQDSNTRLLVVGEPKEMVEKAFEKELVADKVDLPGVVSRKKQIVPQLEAAFNA